MTGIYYANTGFITGSSSAINLMSLENPADNASLIQVLRAFVRSVPTGLLSTTTPFMQVLSRAMNVASGSVVTAGQQNTLDPGSACVVRQSPVGSAVSGSIWSDSPGSIISFSGLAGPGSLNEAFPQPNTNSLILQPGEAVMFYVGTASTSWKHWCSITWVE